MLSQGVRVREDNAAVGGVMDPLPLGTPSPICLRGDLEAMPQQDNGRADGL